MKALGPHLPLSINMTDGIKMIRSMKQMIKQHLRMLLQTSPGERVLYNSYGIGIRDYLFLKDEDDLESDINSQVSKYMPYIQLDGVEVDRDEYQLNVKISYYITALGISDIIVLNIGE